MKKHQGNPFVTSGDLRHIGCLPEEEWKDRIDALEFGAFFLFPEKFPGEKSSFWENIGKKEFL